MNGILLGFTLGLVTLVGIIVIFAQNTNLPKHEK
jgi:hypothetical protein